MVQLKVITRSDHRYKKLGARPGFEPRNSRKPEQELYPQTKLYLIVMPVLYGTVCHVGLDDISVKEVTVKL